MTLSFQRSCSIADDEVVIIDETSDLRFKDAVLGFGLLCTGLSITGELGYTGEAGTAGTGVVGAEAVVGVVTGAMVAAPATGLLNLDGKVALFEFMSARAWTFSAADNLEKNQILALRRRKKVK